MKATGVVRRIDELGRIVIPKEIRKSLHIKEGESLEIYLNMDSIVLKKYSSFENLKDFFKNYVDAMFSIINKNILITDRDNVVAVAGDLRKKYLGKKISSELDEIMQKRSAVSSFDFEEVCFINDTKEKTSYCVSPIIANGDVIGSVIIMSSTEKITEFEEKTAIIASKFLSNYIE